MNAPGTGGPDEPPTGSWNPDFSAPVPQGVFPRVPGVRLDEQIGRGGYATVYRARQLSVDRDVAVKVDDRRLLLDRDKRRFTREIVAAGSVSAHPHIVTVYDGGTTPDDHPYLVMELYPGGSYSDRIRASGPVPPAEVMDVGLGIADALAVAHAEGILHRDVKPGNILISRYGTPALADFGLAALPRAAEGYSVTMESLTPSYAPPEAFGGSEPTAAMDIYSLGATLYALILGRSPRSDKSGTAPPLARLLFMLNDPLPAPEVPGAQSLMLVIWRATAFDPRQRYLSAAQMRDDLAIIKAGGVIHDLPADVTGMRGVDEVLPAHRRSGRRWRWVGAAAAVTAVVLAAVVVANGRGSTGGVAQAGAGSVVAPVARTGAPLDTELSRLAPAVGVPVSGAGQTPSRAVTGQTVQKSGPGATAPTSASSSRSTPTSSGSPVVSAVPAAGSCWGGLVDISGTKTASQIPCTQPHYWEAYATGVLDAATATPYDDDVAKDPVVARTCTQKALKTYVGSSRKGSLDVDVVPPRELAFASGQKGFWCVVSVPDAGEVTGSIKGR